MCSAKTQGRTCHCQVEGRTGPSKIPPWIDWCTCDNWKASMLTETGPRDTNCRCPAGGRPRPNSILPEVTWCSCGTGGQLDNRTNTRDFPKTPEKNTEDPEVTAEGGEEKSLSTDIGGETSKLAETPIEEDTRNQYTNSKENHGPGETPEPETKTTTNDIEKHTPRKEGESIATQEEACGRKKCSPRPCSIPYKA